MYAGESGWGEVLVCGQLDRGPHVPPLVHLFPSVILSSQEMGTWHLASQTHPILAEFPVSLGPPVFGPDEL